MQNGFDNLKWFIGVVEDIGDGQLLGRVRVRAFGIHPDSRIDVRTEDLPWAYVVLGTYNTAYKPPPVGEWVFGFFMDGAAAQQPFIIGTLLGMKASLPNIDPSKGFFAASSGNPQDFVQSASCNIFQPDLSPLARGENLQNTSVFTKAVMVDEGYPGPAYNASYPHNYVHETQSGHAFELDDTPGHERVHLFHRTGSNIEIDSRGNVVAKTVGDNYISIDRNGHVTISGDYDITVKGSANMLVGTDANITVEGDLTTTVHGDHNINVGGSLNLNVGNTIKLRGAQITNQATTGGLFLDSAGPMQLRTDSTATIKSSGNMSLVSDADLILSSGGNASINGGGKISFTGSTIHFNDPGSAAAIPGDIDPNLGQTELPEPPKPKIPIRVSLHSYPVSNYAYADDSSDDGTSSFSTTSTIPNPTLGTSPVNLEEIYDMLRGTGLTHYQSIGVMANMNRESAFKPGAIGDNGNSYGLVQYNRAAGRLDPFVANVPDWQTNPQGQIDYIFGVDPLGKKFKTTSFNSSLDAANWFTKNFEIPLNADEYVSPGGYNSQIVPQLEKTISDIKNTTGVLV